MTIFFETIHCSSRVHCKICRDREGGRQWRTGIRSAIEADSAGPKTDFECPFGLPWGFAGFDITHLKSQTSTMKLQIARGKTLAEERIENFCRVCETFKAGRCGLYRGGRCTPCEFSAYLNRPGAICPAEKPFESESDPQGNNLEKLWNLSA